MLIIVSTLAVSTFASILIYLYHQWRIDFDLPMEDNAVGSFWKILINATTYALSILIQQGINNKSISSIFSFLRKILRKYYSQFFKRRGPFVPMVNSFDVGTLAPNDHNIYRFVREHIDILFDFDQVEANSNFFGRVGRKFRPTDVPLNKPLVTVAFKKVVMSFKKLSVFR